LLSRGSTTNTMHSFDLEKDLIKFLFLMIRGSWNFNVQIYLFENKVVTALSAKRDHE
jgi:hypothetical protein